MKSLIYDVYRHGHAGLSNLIMSIEVGVVLSRLTDRLLVLRGNKVPFANVVRYGDTVRNTYPSRVTDLIELGVPWTDAENVDLAAFAVHELCDQPSWDCVCYFPSWLSTESTDILAFAGERKTFITVQEELQDVPALSFSGGPKHHTLSFYSYFFYLDRSAQLLALDALRFQIGVGDELDAVGTASDPVGHAFGQEAARALQALHHRFGHGSTSTSSGA